MTTEPILHRASPTAIPVDDAFALALERHKQNLTPEELKAFSAGNNISPDQLLADVRNFDMTHSENSHSRKCATRVEGFLTVLNGYLVSVGVITQHSPEVSSVVVGGIKLIVDVRQNFPSLFTFVRLTKVYRSLEYGLRPFLLN